jgi:hypothetical protein
MNKFNIDPLFNKHAALGEMLIKEQGINKAIESLIESIDDLKPDEMQEENMECFVEIKKKLTELL